MKVTKPKEFDLTVYLEYHWVKPILAWQCQHFGNIGLATKALFVVPKDYHISANSVLLSLV